MDFELYREKAIGYQLIEISIEAKHSEMIWLFAHHLLCLLQHPLLCQGVAHLQNRGKEGDKFIVGNCRKGKSS